MLNSNPTGGISATSLDVWREIRERGGLQPDRWDADLLADVCARVGSPIFARNAQFETWLRAQAPPVERLVSAVLAAVSSYGGMMNDLLHLVAKNGGNAFGSDDAIVMAFDFDSPDRADVKIDLEAFKRSARHFTELTAARPIDAAPFRAVFYDGLGAAARSVEECCLEDELGAFFSKAGPPPPVPHSVATVGELDRQLARFWNVWDGVRNYTQVLWDRRQEPEVGDLDEAAWALLNDRRFGDEPWLVAAARAAHRVTRLSEDDQRACATSLERHFLRGLEEAIVPVSASVSQLLELLSLPVFQQRHELYSAWLLTQIIDAWPGSYELHLLENGALRFPFRPTHFATLHGGDEDLFVVGELRTPLAEDWNSSTRKQNVQPDYSIARGGTLDTMGQLVDPVALAPESIIVDVEAKQYLRPNYRNFSSALADYAVSHTDSTVFLVNHGRLTDQPMERRLDQIKALPAHTRGRTHAFGFVFPRGGSGQPEFLAALRSTLPPLRAGKPVSADACCQACTASVIHDWLHAAPSGHEVIGAEIDADGHTVLRIRLAPIPCEFS